MPLHEFTPSAALVADAGAFAPAIARVFPRPHRAYFDAEPPRRRAAQLVAARADPRELSEALQYWSLRRLISEFHPDAPQGLAAALKKLDGEAWGPADYNRLLHILKAGGPGAKALQHAEIITVQMVLILDALPEPLRRARLLTHVRIVQMANLVWRATKRCCGTDAQKMTRLADRLERARSTHMLFRMLIDEIGVDQLAPPPIPGTDWLKPIATSSAIRSAALRFQNCLEGRIPWLLMGRGAYYEVIGEEPAIVEIVRDKLGMWIVGEVRGHANHAVSGELWLRIRLHLEKHGAFIAHKHAPDQLALDLAAAAGW